jgi:hypothetical protein
MIGAFKNQILGMESEITPYFTNRFKSQQKCFCTVGLCISLTQATGEIQWFFLLFPQCKKMHFRTSARKVGNRSKYKLDLYDLYESMD